MRLLPVRKGTPASVGLVLGFAAATAGCNTLQNDAQRGQYVVGRWPNQMVFTTGNVRTIMTRADPLGSTKVIVCTEPSPDVATAIGTLLQADLKGQAASKASGEASLTASSSELVAELAGRSTALLGLRDGLYKACEAYANGIIGDDAYALLLARYGQLMVTLFLGQDTSSAATQEAKATSPPPPTGAPTTPPSATTPSSKQSASLDATPRATGFAAAEPATRQRGGAGLPARPDLLQRVGFGVALPRRDDPTIEHAAQGATADESFVVTLPGGQQLSGTVNLPVDAAGAPPKTADFTIKLPDGKTAELPDVPLRPVAVHAPAPAPAKPRQAPSAPAKPAPTESGAPGPGQALQAMQQAYFNLGKDPLGMLLVACVNENDSSRPHFRYPNQWLRNICDRAGNIRTLATLAALQDGAFGTNPQAVTRILNQLPR